MLFEVVQALLKVHPEAAQTKETCGRLPLHYAACRQASVEVVQALLKAHPGAAQTTDSVRLLPLHIAAVQKASVEVVRALLAAYPKAVKTDISGLPLHFAAEGQASLEVVQALLKAQRASGLPPRPGGGAWPGEQARGLWERNSAASSRTERPLPSSCACACCLRRGLCGRADGMPTVAGRPNAPPREPGEDGGEGVRAARSCLRSASRERSSELAGVS